MSDESSPPPRPTNWPAGWHAVDPPTAALLEAELKRELHKSHTLYGLQASALGRRFDQDDVLFLVRRDQSLLAEVHLTWGGRAEKTAKWPSTKLYERFEDCTAQQWPEPE